ncbi:LORF2 protein, partial [Crocuta crocuta]
HIKRCSISLNIRELQIESAMKYHLTSLGMASIKKTKTGAHGWLKCKSVQSLWKTGQWFFKRLNIELPYDSAILLLDKYPQKVKNFCTPIFIQALFTVAKTWKQPTCPLRNKWMSKM